MIIQSAGIFSGLHLFKSIVSDFLVLKAGDIK